MVTLAANYVVHDQCKVVIHIIIGRFINFWAAELGSALLGKARWACISRSGGYGCEVSWNYLGSHHFG